MFHGSPREFQVTGDAPRNVGAVNNVDLIPEFSDVIQLMNSIDRKIDDCGVEWQAEISQVQWEIFATTAGDDKSWRQSVLSRTYFADKNLDVAFLTLLKHKKTFFDHLQNFVALIKGEKPVVAVSQTSDAYIQCSETTVPDECDESSLNVDTSNSGKLSGHKYRKVAERVLSNARDSLSDVIEAKINFDSKFLGFEALLNRNSCSPPEPSTSLDRISSSIRGTAYKTTKNVNRGPMQKRRRRYSNRIKQKRLMKSMIPVTKHKVPKDSLKSLKIPVPNEFYFTNPQAPNIDQNYKIPASS